MSAYMDSAPSERAIIVDHWQAEAENWYEAAQRRMNELDALTLNLELAFGHNWRYKVERKLRKNAR